MKNKILSVSVSFLILFAMVLPPVFAEGLKQGAASLFLPTTGQAMNGELGNTKTKFMASLEVAAISTVAILGIAVGGGVVWVGLAPLMANHAWSSVDAYKNAKNRHDPVLDRQLFEAQRTIELSRERRFEREQAARSDIRERVMQAGQESASS